MIDKLSSDLARDEKHANISPDVLELMGKQAANIYMDKGISLNESVSKLAAAHDDINQEQIKRICEFANTAVYLAKHDQSKTAGSKESYPEFDLADPNRVVQELSDGTKSTITTKVDSDYSKQPEKKEKTSMVKTASVSSAKASAERAFEEMFTAKTAEDLEFSKDTAISEVMSAKDQLKGLRDHLSSAGEQFDLMHKEASEEFYELSKRHIMNGGSFADISKAASASGGNVTQTNAILTPVIMRLVTEKVASVQSLKEQMKGLEKVAHRSINPDHPLVQTAGTVRASANEIEKIAQGLKEVDIELGKVNDYIKTALQKA